MLFERVLIENSCSMSDVYNFTATQAVCTPTNTLDFLCILLVPVKGWYEMFCVIQNRTYSWIGFMSTPCGD